MIPLTIIGGETILAPNNDYDIIIQAGAKATILATATSEQKINVVVQEGSEVIFYTLHNNSTCFTQGVVMKDAKLEWVDILMNSNLTLQTNLVEPGAQMVAMQGFIGLTDIKSDVVHKSSHTSSIMKAKGILQDSIGKYKGTIRIEPKSAGCNAHQRSDILLLDEKSKGDAEPVLDVNNDDVSCSHGATLGQIDNEQLFYLTSRGLDENSAKQMIIEGFLTPIVSKIPNEKIKEEIIIIIKNEFKVDNERLNNERLNNERLNNERLNNERLNNESSNVNNGIGI
jgi:Fe-S cluster assembly protein SufD